MQLRRGKTIMRLSILDFNFSKLGEPACCEPTCLIRAMYQGLNC